MKKRIFAFLLAFALIFSMTSGISLSVFAVEEAANETEAERRQKVVDYMYEMCTVEWTPTTTLTYKDTCGHDYTYVAGTTYKGLPYTHKCGSLERMKSYIGENNVMNTDSFPTNGYTSEKNGWDLMLGNDCADSVFWAWSQVTNDIKFTFTDDMLLDPAIKPVGSYAFINNDIFTTAQSLTMAEMCEAYAQVQMGDGLLKPGHARLAASDAVVVRNPDGTINPYDSYILIHEQGGQSREYFNTQHSTCGVNVKESFWDLWMKNHLPITIDAFANGDTAGTATMRQGSLSKGKLPVGTINSTGRINFVTIEVYDAQGTMIKSLTKYPCNGAHNNTYNLDGTYTYDDKDAGPGFWYFPDEGETYKIFVSDMDSRIEVTIKEAPAHQSHCVCGGDGVGMPHESKAGQTHACSDRDWQPLPVNGGQITGQSLTGSYYLTCDTYITGSAISWASGALRICLNGYRLYTVNARLFYQKGADRTYTLHICDCSEEKSGRVENTSPGYKDDDGNYIRIQAGSIASSGGSDAEYTMKIVLWGGTYSYSGVPNRNGGGLFHIYGGSSLTIYKAKLIGGKSNPTANDGGLIFATGASTVTIYGGNFSDGSARNGGLIRAAGSDTKLNIYGGTFRSGTATGYGGLISANGPTTIENATFVSGVAQYGGLLHLGGDTTIKNCYLSSGVASDNGGNIRKDGSEATLAITDTLITSGSAGTNGGNIYIGGGTLSVSGATQVIAGLVGEKANNVFLKDGQKIVIDGTGLTGDAKIGVTLETGTGTIADWADNTQTQYFSADNGHSISYNNTSVTVGADHSYSTEWSKDAANHWYECACGAKKDEAPHAFDNACDTTCNDCGYTRTTEHSFTEKIEDTAHLVAGTGVNCQDAKKYYYDCVHCDQMGTISWTSTTYGEHSFTEKIEDTAHLVAGTGANCQDAKEYYYDCAYCEKVGTTTWTSTSCGEHSFTEKIEDAAHLVAGTGVNCQDAKKYYYDCAYCDQKGTTTWTSTTYGEHSFTEKIEDTAHFVEGTGAHCQDAKKYYYDCAHCAKVGTTTWTSTTYGDHIFTEKIEDPAHFVEGTGAHCQDAKKYYYDCAHCAKVGTTTWTSTTYGDHIFTEQIEDAAHLVAGTGANCQSAKEYYHDCVHCDQKGTTTWTSTTMGDHEFDMTQWGYQDKTAGHAHKCKHCSEHDAVQPHTPGAPATEDSDQICTTCQMVLQVASGHIHANHITKVAKNGATCTVDGNIEYYECSCGKYFKDANASTEITDKNSVVIKAGHTYGDLIAKQDAVHTATELKTGMEAHYFCDECDTYFTTEKVATTKEALVIAAPTHTYGEWTESKAPTCTEKGEETRTCACGAKETRDTDAKGHTYGDLIAKVNTTHTATELKAGMEAHYFCDDCDTYFTSEKVATTKEALVIAAPTHSYSDAWGYKGADGHAHVCACGAKDTVVAHIPGAAATENNPQTCTACGYMIQPALGHTHKFGEWTQSKAPTCTVKGEETRTCPCGHEETREVKELGHDWKDATCTTPKTCKTCGATEGNALGHDWKDATCTEPKTCKTCGTTEGAAKGHSFSEWTESKAPTCTEKGEETRTCACGEKETREVAALGHKHNTQWSKDATNHWHECSVCGDQADKAAHIPGAAATETTAQTCTACGYVLQAPLGHTHSFGDWTVTKAPTCTLKGIETRVCSCGAEETREVAATGHTFGEWAETKAPTCTEKGEETRTCACGEKETREVPMVDHKYDDKGDCTCGAKDPNWNPPTGDNTSLIALAFAALMSVAAAFVMIFKRKTAN